MPVASAMACWAALKASTVMPAQEPRMVRACDADILLIEQETLAEARRQIVEVTDCQVDATGAERGCGSCRGIGNDFTLAPGASRLRKVTSRGRNTV